ncbi:hypothetical protein FRB93_003273 [Tulasnella sp. JGI-2019a]|nr:hypothetical protein FRB93_003273 [Tulasnella sp. JGI-2019a]
MPYKIVPVYPSSFSQPTRFDMDNTLALPVTSDYFAQHGSRDGPSKTTRERRSSMRQPNHPTPALELSYLSSYPNTLAATTPSTLSEVPSPTAIIPPPIISARQLVLYRAALYWAFFMNGWSDGAAGPIIPVVQRVWGLSFTVVSMLFVAASIGFLIGASLNIFLTDRYGLGKIITGGAVIQMIAYSLIGAGINFPIMCFGYGLCGLTMSLQAAQGNIFIAIMPGNATSMAMLHGFCGIGAMTAPLAATQFAQLQHWSYFYSTSLGVATISYVLSLCVFKLKRLEELIPHAGTDLTDSSPLVNGNRYKQILRQKSVLLLAIWSLVYVGAEVTIGGWIVTFLEQLRGGGPSTGYVSSGFFGGMTAGRFFLWPITDWIGKRKSMYIYLIIAIGLEIVVWQAPI